MQIRLETKESARKEAPSLASTSRYIILVCAYNEAGNLGHLLSSLPGDEVLVIDDGSTDQTGDIARLAGVKLFSHPVRLGKTASLRHGILYTQKNGYDILVDLGADALPEPGSIRRLIEKLQDPTVGGSSAKQIPLPAGSMLAYHIDELIWSILAKCKEYQMRTRNDSYLGAVMFAFKTASIRLGEGTNDDELVGESLRSHGLRVVFADDAVVYFDASSSLHHILDRRVRMVFGHMVERRGGAPTGAFMVEAVGLVATLVESKERLRWVVPALAIESVARLWAWYDFRKGRFAKYSRWMSREKSHEVLKVSFPDKE